MPILFLAFQLKLKDGCQVIGHDENSFGTVSVCIYAYVILNVIPSRNVTVPQVQGKKALIVNSPLSQLYHGINHIPSITQMDFCLSSLLKVPGIKRNKQCSHWSQRENVLLYEVYKVRDHLMGGFVPVVLCLTTNLHAPSSPLLVVTLMTRH